MLISSNLALDVICGFGLFVMGFFIDKHLEEGKRLKIFFIPTVELDFEEDS